MLKDISGSRRRPRANESSYRDVDTEGLEDEKLFAAVVAKELRNGYQGESGAAAEVG